MTANSGNGAVYVFTATTPLPPPPVCQNRAVSTAAGTPKTVALSCSGQIDSRAIVSPPAHGTLGAIDQAAGTVVYTPNAGYSGPDSFTFSATNGGGTSNTATDSIIVTPPSSPTLPPSNPPPAISPPPPSNALTIDGVVAGPDGTLTVDFETRDGRRQDHKTGQAPRQAGNGRQTQQEEAEAAADLRQRFHLGSCRG
jgi:hypothetical protein